MSRSSYNSSSILFIVVVVVIYRVISTYDTQDKSNNVFPGFKYYSGISTCIQTAVPSPLSSSPTCTVICGLCRVNAPAFVSSNYPNCTRHDVRHSPIDLFRSIQVILC